MAIRYYAGDFHWLSSGDAKPTGILPGARYLEKETLKTFVLTGNNIIVELTPIEFTEYHYLTGAQLVSGQLLGIPNSRRYNPNSGELQVYVNGCIQRPGTGTAANNANHWDYRETNPTGVSFNYYVATGAFIEFIKRR